MSTPPKFAVRSSDRPVIARFGDDVWIGELEQLVVDCTEADPGDERRVLRQLALLLGLAPHGLALSYGLSGKARMATNPHQFETMLAAQAWESAALALLDGQTGYLLSRGASGIYLASVYPAGMTDDITAEAASAALALVAAHAAALAIWARSNRLLGPAGAVGSSGLLN